MEAQSLTRIDYLEGRNGAQSGKEFLESLTASGKSKLRQSLDAALYSFSKEKYSLCHTNAAKPITRVRNKPVLPGIYEIRKQQARVIVYDDLVENTIWVVDGFLKKKRRQEDDIERAVRVIEDYLSRRNRGDIV